MPEAPRDDEAPRAIIDLTKARRFTVRETLITVGVMCLILLVLEGPSIRNQGEEMESGIVRTAVLAVGEPTGWLGDRLPFHDATEEATAWLSPDGASGDGEGGFANAAAPLPSEGGGGATTGPPPVTPDAFAPSDLGQQVEKKPLKTVLVTGDSLAQPLDSELARRFADAGVDVTREPHLGTGISKTDLLDWGELSNQQAKKDYDAVVMFMGANEGFPMPGPDGGDVKCCDAEWAAIYASRARAMMDAYRRDGAGRIYWLTLPGPRDANRIEIARVVNAAIVAAAAPYRAQVRIVDMVRVFTPDYDYRDSMDVGGSDTIVRESDGIHLNGDGSDVAADELQRVMAGDFTW
jgi:lysophospholipase L1-like esterase